MPPGADCRSRQSRAYIAFAPKIGLTDAERNVFPTFMAPCLATMRPLSESWLVREGLRPGVNRRRAEGETAAKCRAHRHEFEPA